MEFKLGEINIITSNLARSEKFYVGLLGFKVLSEEEGALHLEGAGHKFLLLPLASEDVNDEKYCKKAAVSFDLLVKNIHESYKYFKDNNIVFELDISEGKDHFFIRDPDGLVIEVLQN